VSPIQVGALMGDRASDRGPIGQAYRRVAAVLNGQPLEGASIGLVFDIEGSLNTPDYAGLKVGRVDRKERSIQVWMAVPATLSERPNIEAELMDLAEAAMLLAGGRLAAARIEVDPDAVTDAIGEARLALGLGHRRDNRPPVADVSEIVSTKDLPIEVQLPLPTDLAVGDDLLALFVLEETLDRRLQDEGIGRVDGNEVGSGTFTMFLSIRRGGRRRASAILEEVLPPEALVTPPLTSDRRRGRTGGTDEPDRRPRVSRRTEAITRIAAALQEVGLQDGHGMVVVVEASKTPFYIQFAPTQIGVNGEAVGLANLPRLQVHNAGDEIIERLEKLGWAPPDDGSHGNWMRRWDQAAWDPQVVARLVVDTFARAYGLEPWALVASTATFEAT
jgi:type III secretion system-like peptide-binding chaperone